LGKLGHREDFDVVNVEAQSVLKRRAERLAIEGGGEE